jgi:hypothetical protein
VAAWSVLPDCPKRLRAADNGGDGQWPEIPTVKGVGGLPVHEEDVALGEDAAALPKGQRAAMAVALARVSDRKGIDGDGAADAADGLTAERQNAL